MKDGLQPYCISCVKQKQKQFYNENPDKKENIMQIIEIDY